MSIDQQALATGLHEPTRDAEAPTGTTVDGFPIAAPPAAVEPAPTPGPAPRALPVEGGGRGTSSASAGRTRSTASRS